MEDARGRAGWIGRFVAFDEACMARVSEPRGALRILAIAVTALGSAVITLPAELSGWLLAAPPLADWLWLCLLADVPGHLVLIVPLRFATRRQRPTPMRRSFFGFDTWNVYSFPSAHSLRTWTLATILSHALPWGWPLFAAAAAVITGTRIVLRKHWPSDIVVGSVLGVAWGLVMVAILSPR